MTRDVISSGPASGADVMANLNGHIQRLWDAVALPLTDVGGTADALTADLDPPLLSGLVLGMKFSLTIVTDNTAAVTLSINGATAVPIVAADGTGLTTGALRADMRVLLEWDGTALRAISGVRDGESSGPARITFTASGTWTVPTGYPDDTPVLIQAWGAGGGGGGGGGNRGGGGGGACAECWVRYADLSATYTVTIGAGGAVGSSGGNTSIGTLLTAFGGGAGGAGFSDAPGGGGGGEAGAGQSVTFGAAAAGGAAGGGDGGDPAGSLPNGQGATGRTGGGGGGGNGGNGGAAALGGGGGGGSSGAGGSSMQAGNGGANGSAGSAPAGGGGGNAAGARGEARMTIFG